MRAAKKKGCAIHGHIMRPVAEEINPLPNDPIYAERIVRYYECLNCPHTAEEESLTLKEEFHG